MSFQLNLSSLTLGAKERLARLDAAGGALKARILSPGASGSSPVGSAVSFADPSASLGGVGVASSTTGVGVSGESVVSGGGSGSLSAFVLTPELHEQLCLGAVAGGVKFCTLGAVSCNFVTHAKKVEVFADHLYVATGKNSAFTHHHVPVASLTLDQLEGLLQERHSKEEWTYLIRVVNVQGDGRSPVYSKL